MGDSSDKGGSLLEITTATTKLSLNASASGSAGASGSSSSHNDPANEIFIKQYETFVQNQESTFAEEIESLISQIKASTEANKIFPRDEFKAGDPACDHFIIIGCDQNRDPPEAPPAPATAADKKKRTEADYKNIFEETIIYHPKVLFHYPTEAPLEKDVPGLTHYCFPDGAVPQKFVRKKSSKEKSKSVKFSFTRIASFAPPPAAPNQSEIALSPVAQSLALDSIIGVNPEFFAFPGTLSNMNSKHSKNVLSYHCEPENSSVFVIMGEDTVRYGICVYKEVIAYQTEEFYCVEPLCFCVISSVPFINFFIDSIISILDFPRINDLAMLQKDQLDIIFENATKMCETCNKDKDVDDDNSDVKVDVCDEKDPVTLDYTHAMCAIMQLCKLVIPPLKKPLKYFPATRTVGFETVRPQFEEESQLLQEFGGTVLFNVLPVPTIIQLLTALLLEYKVLLVSPNKRLLSATVLSLLPLIRPFVYDAPVFPVLPLALFKSLGAPGPALVGLTKQPFVQSTEGFLIVNLHTGVVQCTKPLPNLPDLSKLTKKIEEMAKKVGVPSIPSKGIGPEIPSKIFASPTPSSNIEVLSGLFMSYFSGLFEDFQVHCISNVTSESSTTTIFMDDSFVESQTADRKPFIEQFVKTGIFKRFEYRQLSKIDHDKTEFRKSLRSRGAGTLGRDRKKKNRTLKY